MKKTSIQTIFTGDKIFRFFLASCASLILLIVVGMIAVMTSNSWLSIERFGIGFLFGTVWDPIKGEFGAMPFIYGTLVSSLLALLIATPLSIGVAVFLVEQAPKGLARPLSFLVELLAAIPSVVYGLWAIFVLAPLLRVYVQPVLQTSLGWLPFFKGSATGLGMLTGGIILAIMITPIITAVVRDVLEAVPVTQREASLALGATHWETTKIVLANASSGIAGAVILGLGRAIGETMAVRPTSFFSATGAPSNVAATATPAPGAALFSAMRQPFSSSESSLRPSSRTMCAKPRSSSIWASSPTGSMSLGMII